MEIVPPHVSGCRRFALCQKLWVLRAATVFDRIERGSLRAPSLMPARRAFAFAVAFAVAGGSPGVQRWRRWRPTCAVAFVARRPTPEPAERSGCPPATALSFATVVCGFGASGRIPVEAYSVWSERITDVSRGMGQTAPARFWPFGQRRVAVASALPCPAVAAPLLASGRVRFRALTCRAGQRRHLRETDESHQRPCSSASARRRLRA